MEIEVTSFCRAIYPNDTLKCEELALEVSGERFKGFNKGLFDEVVEHFQAHGKLPEIPCDVVQLTIPTEDRQNYKILAHYCGCTRCKQAVTIQH